jgi:ADP-ribosylglycohydrolase
MATNHGDLSHEQRLERARLSLRGLAVGDAFGQSFFFVPAHVADQRLNQREAGPAPWFFTDDTVMARAVWLCLEQHQGIDTDDLALTFAQDYAREPDRGYGGTARGILREIGKGVHWSIAAVKVFDGEGSCGNGGAMRSAPIGAYFADNMQRLIQAATQSAAVTHAHPDGQTGAIAVALAAAWILDQRKPSTDGMELIRFVLSHLPQTETYWRLKKALSLPLQLSAKSAALILGNGSQLISSDTVPFCLWLTCRHLDCYTEAMWQAVSVEGDMDTNCAIVGSLVSLATGAGGIPEDWKECCEPLQLSLA